MSVEFRVAAGVPKLPYRFISAFGYVAGVYSCCWLRAVAPARPGLADVAGVVLPADAVLSAAAATIGLAPIDCAAPVVPVVP